MWSAPAVAGLDVPDLAADATITARSGLEALPSWSTTNLVDGQHRSVAAGAKGYTSTRGR